MVKKRTPEQDAIREAYNKPTRKWFCSRRMFWVNGGGWSFFTNWWGFSFSAGAVEEIAGGTAPKSTLLVSLDWRPFGFSIWWRSKRLVWLGYWEWEKAIYEKN